MSNGSVEAVYMVDLGSSIQDVLCAEFSVKNFCIVVDPEKNNSIVGVLTEGDLRRKLVKIRTLEGRRVDDFIGPGCFVFNSETSELQYYDRAIDSITDCPPVESFPKMIPVVNSELQFEGMLDERRITELQKFPGLDFSCDIYGLGFVGLPLAALLASKGVLCLGIDCDESLVNELNNGGYDYDEPLLNDFVRKAIANGLLKCGVEAFRDVDCKRQHCHIITVGTPICASGPDLSSLISSVKAISRVIQPGDLIVLRSTVPVGTTREVGRWLSQANPNLKLGDNVHLVFAPERVVEGRVIEELAYLPQVIGAYSEKCGQIAHDLFSKICEQVLIVESLESAELVKLSCNTYRDLSFAFANEIALLSREYGIDVYDVIQAANRDYSRSSIPKPSPGVGGYCLVKDPVLFQFSGRKYKPSLGGASRLVNNQASKIPRAVLTKFISKFELDVSSMSVLILGIAFKGYPATADTRGSTSLDVINDFIDLGILNIVGFDPSVSISPLSCENFQLSLEMPSPNSFDAVFVLNNNPEFSATEFAGFQKKTLIFDGWNLFFELKGRRIKNLCYSNLSKDFW